MPNTRQNKEFCHSGFFALTKVSFTFVIDTSYLAVTEESSGTLNKSVFKDSNST